MSFDLFQHITDRMIEELENGTIPWRKPWVSSGSCVSHLNGRPYSLLNTLMLKQPGEYATFNQIRDEGGRVVKGAKAKMVVFWKPMKTEKKDLSGSIVRRPDGTPEEDVYFLLRYYNVFRVGSDTEGISEKYADRMPCAVKPDQKAESVLNAYIRASGVTLVHEKGDRAFYTPAFDRITLPLMDQFRSVAEYYGTAFHEATHSTGHASRLDRLDDTAFMGSETYSREELVAEMGSAALVNYCGLETEKSFRNSAGYISSWLSVLKGDKRFVVSAASKAEKAVELILGCSPDEE